MKKLLLLALLTCIALGIFFSIKTLAITSFEECVKAGHNVLESYPAQCKTPDGRTFTQQLADPLENEKLVTFNGDEVVFQHPQTWHPTQKESTTGMIGRTIHLGIPEIESDQDAGFSRIGLTAIESDDIARQEELIINKRQWVKWIRKGEGYTSYDYYTATEEKDGSFGIHVTVGEENEILEKQLDSLVHSLTFK